MAPRRASDARATYDLATDEADILARAEDILRRRLERLGTIGNPRDSADFLRMRLGHLDHEEFHMVWLDNRHRIIAVDKLFTGTIDGASVHPSGVAEPSAADRAITAELKKALDCIGVRTLDHVIVSAGEEVSMAARGLM
jgi:DNA repair protein RadC